jgi:hypothetical protein
MNKSFCACIGVVLKEKEGSSHLAWTAWVRFPPLLLLPQQQRIIADAAMAASLKAYCCCGSGRRLQWNQRIEQQYLELDDASGVCQFANQNKYI